MFYDIYFRILIFCNYETLINFKCTSSSIADIVRSDKVFSKRLQYFFSVKNPDITNITSKNIYFQYLKPILKLGKFLIYHNVLDIILSILKEKNYTVDHHGNMKYIKYLLLDSIEGIKVVCDRDKNNVLDYEVYGISIDMKNIRLSWTYYIRFNQMKILEMNRELSVSLKRTLYILDCNTAHILVNNPDFF